MQRFKTIPFLLILLLFACAPVEEDAASNAVAVAINSTRTLTDRASDVVTITERAEVVEEKPLHTDDGAKDDNAATHTVPTEPATTLPATSQLAVSSAASEATTVLRQPTDENLTVTPIPATQQTTPEMKRSEESITVPITLQSFVETLIDDLVQQKGVKRSTISVASLEEVVWNDGSLGCPQPGMAYTQALVNGFYVILQADGTQFPYHTRGTRSFVLCDNQKGTPPAVGTNPDA
jgi:hypothetical protein